MDSREEIHFDRVRDVFFHFFNREPDSITKIRNGHINDSYIAESEGRYVCQRLKGELYNNRLNELLTNYLAYLSAYDKVGDEVVDWKVPVWVTDSEGEYFFSDSENGIWRLYHYIDGYTLINAGNTRDIYELGKGLSKMHHILSSVDKIIMPETSDIYNLKYHYDRYCELKSVVRDKDDICDICDMLIRETASRYLSIAIPTEETIHGDAKLQNAVFSDGRVISFIDLDTIMYGNRQLEIADSLRSCCIRDGRIDPEYMDAFIQGYEDTDFFRINANDKEMISLLVYRVCFELGIRYYNDILSGAGYFGEEYPGQKKEKAQKLLRLSCTG